MPQRDRIGSALPCFTGLVIYAVGIAFTGSLPATAPLAVIVVGMLVMAVGTGLFQSPNNSLVMGSVAPEHLGFAGSVISLVRYLGMSVGVSGGSALLYGRMSEGAGYAVDAFIEGRPDLLCSGFSFTFAVIAALVAACSRRRGEPPLGRRFSRGHLVRRGACGYNGSGQTHMRGRRRAPRSQNRGAHAKYRR